MKDNTDQIREQLREVKVYNLLGPDEPTIEQIEAIIQSILKQERERLVGLLPKEKELKPDEQYPAGWRSKMRPAPLHKAQEYIDRENTRNNNGREPYAHWYLASQYWCPFCNQYLGGYNGQHQFWRCECSTWYETKDKGWERNKHTNVTDLQPSDQDTNNRKANAPPSRPTNKRTGDT